MFLRGDALDDADVVAILDKNVVDTFPASRGAVDQNKIPNAMLLVLR
jgi:hypothetical protein